MVAYLIMKRQLTSESSLSGLVFIPYKCIFSVPRLATLVLIYRCEQEIPYTGTKISQSRKICDGVVFSQYSWVTSFANDLSTLYQTFGFVANS